MNNFTPEQLTAILQNPYTFEVTSKRVVFTLEFKEFVMTQSKAGKTSINIFRMAGYDPDAFGAQRVYSLIKNIKREAASPDGLKRPVKQKKNERFATQELEKQNTKKALKEMQQEILYLEQEVEFLKKISAIQKKYRE